MPIATFTGSSSLNSFNLPFNATVTAVTVNGTAATYTAVPGGKVTISAPAVTDTSVVVITYTQTNPSSPTAPAVSGAVSVSGTVTANQGAPYVATANSLNSAATTNATLVKATPGTVYSVTAFNGGATAAYLKFYNSAVAPVVGTDTPVMVLPIPAGQSISVEFGVYGQRYTVGIGIAITGGAPDADVTAVAASQVKTQLTYI